MKRKNTGSTILFILIPLAVGGLSTLLTHGSMEAFSQLRQPVFAPPAAVFPWVWGVLYLLMGVSAAMVWNSCSPIRGDAIFLFAAQLFVNFWWSIFFFAWELRLFAFFWLLLLNLLVAAMIRRFHRILPLAGKLNIPYLLWLLFAACLNLAVWMLNK